MVKPPEFMPGQLVRLNAFAIECIEPRNGGFKVVTAEGYDNLQDLSYREVKTIPVDSPCLVVKVYPEGHGDRLLVLFEDVLVRINHSFMELFL